MRTAFAVAGAALIVAGVALMLFAHRHVHTGAGLVVAGVVTGGYTVEAFRRGGRDQTPSLPEEDR